MILKSQWQTHDVTEPSAPPSRGPKSRLAPSVRFPVEASASVPLLNASSCTRIHAHDPADQRRWDVAQIGGRAWKGAWHGRSTRFQRFRSETTPAGTSRGGAATPSSNILNFFSLSPPPAVCSRVCCESNDPRLSRKGFRNGVVWLPLRDFLLFFFFFFSFIRFSAERDGEFSRLTFSFPFFLSVETSTKKHDEL